LGSSHTGQMSHCQQDFLQAHNLGERYLETATAWFDPLAASIALHRKKTDQALTIGVNGSQGSGKTTLCSYLCQSLTHSHQLNTVTMSLDDFYLPYAQRQLLAQEVHPLFATRGVPGTHDYNLLMQTLHLLQTERTGRDITIPVFDKLRDDRTPQHQWRRVTSPLDVIIVEGWCLGASAQSESELRSPVNALERDQDADCLWRQTVNRSLALSFPPLYQALDLWVMLQAPSFQSVFAWRQEQEAMLASRAEGSAKGQAMDDKALRTFVAHYERLTNHCLAVLPDKVHHLFTLDDLRQIIKHRQNRNPAPLFQGDI